MEWPLLANGRRVARRHGDCEKGNSSTGGRAYQLSAERFSVSASLRELRAAKYIGAGKGKRESAWGRSERRSVRLIAARRLRQPRLACNGNKLCMSGPVRCSSLSFVSSHKMLWSRSHQGGALSASRPRCDVASEVIACGSDIPLATTCLRRWPTPPYL